MLEAIQATVTKSSIPLTIALPDRDDTPIMLANDRFRSMVGRTDQEIIGRNCRFLQGPLTAPEQRVVFREAIARFTACRGLITNYTADGRAFLNYVLMFPIVDKASGERAILGSQFDITPYAGRDVLDHARVLADVLERISANEQSSTLVASLDAISVTVSRLVQSRLDVAHLDTVVAATQMANWSEATQTRA